MLILHLKRFTQSSKGATKNREAVMIPDWLEVQQRMYQLTAVVNPIGSSMNSGHYTADVKVGSNWKKCDDTIIRGGRKMNSMSTEAYLMFYERKSDEKTPVNH